MPKIKVSLITGHFNVLHAGHIRLFRAAKDVSEKLIIGVLSDEQSGSRALLSQDLRLEGVQTNNLVDEVVLCDNSVSDLVSLIRPDYVFKGREHEENYNEELEAVERYGGKIVFSQSEAVFSSRSWINDETGRLNLKLPKDFCDRRGITKANITRQIYNFRNLNVCVIGDLIVDEYVSCVPLGMSQEEPTIVVSPIDKKTFLGGAGIVAAHCRCLGAQVEFISVCGDDEGKRTAEQALTEAGVVHTLITDDARPTTVKTRYRADGKGLLRVSQLHQGKIKIDYQQRILDLLAKKIDKLDVIIFSDFNYGCLPDTLISKITDLARNKKILLCADSQSSSQIGDVSRFKGMDLMTPTEREARIATRNNQDGLVVLAETLRKQSDAKHIILKLGAEGIIIHSAHKTELKLIDDELQAMCTNATDVAGAGDSMLAVSAMTLATGGSIWNAALLGTIAAAIQVSRIGNRPLSHSELISTTEGLFSHLK